MLTTNCKTTVTVSLDVIHDVMINFVLRVIYTLAYTVLTAVFQMNLDSIFLDLFEPLRILSHVTAPHQVLLGLLFIRFHHLTTGPTQHTPCSSCPYHLGLDYVDIQKVQTVLLVVLLVVLSFCIATNSRVLRTLTVNWLSC